MLSVIKQQLKNETRENETRENEGLSDYVCTTYCLLSILFGKLGVSR